LGRQEVPRKKKERGYPVKRARLGHYGRREERERGRGKTDV